VTDAVRRRAGARLAEDARVAVVPWIVARIIVVSTLALTRHVVDAMHVSPKPIQVRQGLFAWDAAFYRDIAVHGYDAVPKLGLRFFPLLPLLGRAVGVLPGVNARVGVLIVANGAALIFSILIVRLAREETGDAAVATRVAWLAALAPPAFVLVMGYAEALLMALAVGVALAVRSRRWWLVALLGYASGLTRPVGVLIVVFVGVALLVAKQRPRVGEIAALIAPVAGLFTYLLWVRHRTGELFYALRAQESSTLRGKTQDPVRSMNHAVHQLFSGDRFGSGLHAVTAVVLVVLLVVLIRSWPWPYTAYAFASLVVALSANNLDSLERYGLATFPFILAAATVVRPNWERFVWAVCGAGMVGLCVLTFTGTYIP
jgi:hypothetical protein